MAAEGERTTSAQGLMPGIPIPVIILLPHKAGVIVRHRAIGVIDKTHRGNVICPILAGSSTVDHIS